MLPRTKKSAIEGFSELQQPTTQVLEGRRQVEVSQVQKESLFEGRKFLVRWFIEPQLERELSLSHLHSSRITLPASLNLVLRGHDQHDVEKRLHVVPVQVEAIGPVQQSECHEWRRPGPLL